MLLILVEYHLLLFSQSFCINNLILIIDGLCLHDFATLSVDQLEKYVAEYCFVR